MEDLLGTGTITRNCDMLYMVLINTILPLLSIYWPDIQRSTRIIENGDPTGQENTSF